MKHKAAMKHKARDVRVDTVEIDFTLADDLHAVQERVASALVKLRADGYNVHRSEVRAWEVRGSFDGGPVETRTQYTGKIRASRTT
jgi:hypothetical protein